LKFGIQAFHSEFHIAIREIKSAAFHEEETITESKVIDADFSTGDLAEIAGEIFLHEPVFYIQSHHNEISEVDKNDQPD
jgi:hypothetical protein